MTPTFVLLSLAVLPGRYRILDFMRFGLPVSITYSVSVIALLYLSYPFAAK
jgi:hypothetical protein